MADWDEDSPTLRQNLTHILEQTTDQSDQRKIPTLELARSWQRSFLQGLKASNPRYVGTFRGERGLERTGVKIGSCWGVRPAEVAVELRKFEQKLQAAVLRFDRTLPVGKELTHKEVDAVIDLCAWAHAEWVRIHPFANGNGRTARLWANFLAMRYGLPPFVRLRPRPNEGYEAAGIKAMAGEWEPTANVFRRMLNRFLEELGR
ncbi:MAG TPA: Fic family protein [Terriglobales bacterium]|nr:Fic family protein [Terriglobales bacterium]